MNGSVYNNNNKRNYNKNIKAQQNNAIRAINVKIPHEDSENPKTNIFFHNNSSFRPTTV